MLTKLLSELKGWNYDSFISKSFINQLHKTWSLRNEFWSKWLTEKKTFSEKINMKDRAENEPINDVGLAQVRPKSTKGL